MSLKELTEGLGKVQNGSEMISSLALADLDGSGEISYSEFIAATMGEELFLREDYIQTAFNMFDKDKNGSIDFNEFV